LSKYLYSIINIQCKYSYEHLSENSYEHLSEYSYEYLREYSHEYLYELPGPRAWHGQGSLTKTGIKVGVMRMRIEGLRGSACFDRDML